VVRPALPGDYDAIGEIVALAFVRPDEARIVEAVRTAGPALVELVADDAGEVTGHILFSRMTCDPPRFVAALGPLAVRPGVQNRGFGQALSRAGIEAVRALGAEAIVVLGHPTYYPRFGFSAAAARPLASPYAGRDAFMAMELEPGALAGPLKVDYPAAFG
jgi:putative acetyltransferase